MGCQIVITGNRAIKGASGTKHWFLTQEVYCIDRKVRLLVSCDTCDKNASNHLEWFYEITIDNELFRLPVIGAVEVDNLHEINPLRYGVEGDQVSKLRYETLEKDEEFPVNGDYQGYMKEKLGIVQNNKADYSGDVWYNEVTKEQHRNKGLTNESQTG